MAITLILFGNLVDLIGCTRLVVEDMPDTDQLVHYLHQQYPLLQTAKYAIAVDRKLITQNAFLTDGTTVALLPPFSGG